MDGPGPARPREAVLVVNVRSRRGAALHGRVRRMLEERGVVVTAEHLVDDPAAQMPVLLPQVLAARPPLLVVGSGDGTVAGVVDHLAHTSTVLGYLPLGTTNNFGRSLGLPLRLADAVDVVARGRVASVDLGQVNGDWFANLVSMGVSAAVAGRTPHALKRRIGRAAYAVTAARALTTHRAFEAEIRTEDRVWTVRTHQLNIANGRVHAGTPIARDAGVDDRLLVAYALGGSRRFSVATAAARQALTPWQPLERKGYLTGTRFEITTDRPLALDVDGEVTGSTPASVTVTGDAMRVMVPQTFVPRDPTTPR
ncbi:diacylglycerol/lipid kinase family protein [Cellulomonas marina]|uniref:Lipid kinase, YegS/Rv2252/BmrU family n=1 Tax=Cellulomonas marina TaxID=988821 RepID=A0A1I0XXV7_9CELL|nr:diacylglycerol kinase family protein [Cellulomonas marina]GIG28463.1 putative lipid kinase YegS-like protein [Cellulomonas marina]SFB05862.1 lipid kinase, YegS/Rv2252/BmrU family [Cellulomonas marina]